MSEAIPSPLGPNLKQHRTRAGYTQESAARALDVSVRTVVRWETNDSTPAWPDLQALASLYGCSVAAFYERRGEQRANGDPDPVAA